MNRRKFSKIVILGDSAVGKSSLLESLIEGRFINKYKATVGADFYEKEFTVDGKSIVLEFWDTAGQERYRSLGGAFYRGCDVCVLVYDITNRSSFQNVEAWIDDFVRNGSPKDPQHCPFVMIGNKCDLEHQRTVDPLNVPKFMEDNPIKLHLQTSALDIQGVAQAFRKIAQLAALCKKHEKQYEIPLDLRKPCGACLNRKRHKHKRTCC